MFLYFLVILCFSTLHSMHEQTEAIDFVENKKLLITIQQRGKKVKNFSREAFNNKSFTLPDHNNDAILFLLPPLIRSIRNKKIIITFVRMKIFKIY